MSIHLLALWMGFLGSVHCGLMCGPLVLTFTPGGKNTTPNWIQHLVYQSGRILTYGLLGLLIGFFGESLSSFLGHGKLSLGLGILFISGSILYFLNRAFKYNTTFFSSANPKLYAFFGKFYGKPIWPFMAGVMNGLVPCGILYVALASALNAGSPLQSAIFMLTFGLGTLPLLLSVALGGVYIKKYIQFDAQKILPYFTLFLGVLLVFRSLHLGIPFLSPDEHLNYGNAIWCK